MSLRRQTTGRVHDQFVADAARSMEFILAAVAWVDSSAQRLVPS